MSEYTPGPWTAGREERELKGDPDDPWVVYGFSLHIDIASSNDEADARLIAAAPDLLAALEDTFRVLDTTDDADFFAVRDRARAAIAKATGE